MNNNCQNITTCFDCLIRNCRWCDFCEQETASNCETEHLISDPVLCSEILPTTLGISLTLFTVIFVVFLIVIIGFFQKSRSSLKKLRSEICLKTCGCCVIIAGIVVATIPVCIIILHHQIFVSTNKWSYQASLDTKIIFNAIWGIVAVLMAASIGICKCGCWYVDNWINFNFTQLSGYILYNNKAKKMQSCVL
jgi:hypothetical protein